ncbi:MAG: hypothetical protein PHF67_01260 [Candidatus Nanoarchaeia archaeon]|nr:hypothetical protein [Candidatus Nanoarchaeia archaeon]
MKDYENLVTPYGTLSYLGKSSTRPDLGLFEHKGTGEIYELNPRLVEPFMDFK